MSTPGSRRKRDVMTSSSSPHLEYRQRLRNSLSHQRRSSARKSLEFGATPEKKSIDFPVEEEHPVVAAAPSSVNDEDQRVPPIRDFWSSPPPPKPVQEVVGRTVNRYSRRLRTRRLIPQVSDSSSPTQFANNLEPALPKKTVDVHYDQASVFSDYGTASESSSYFQPSSHHASSSHSHIDTAARDKFLHPCNSEQSCTSQSVGYASDLDLDDCMSNLSIDDANRSTQESRHWDSDLEDGKESEWDEDLPSNGLHLNLTDLQLKSLKTFLKTYQGINVLVPLDGYEIFRPQKCVSRSSLRNNQHRGIVRYDLRKRPGRQLETLLTIQVYNHISIESDFLRHGVRIFQVSPIISVQPHNVKFCALYPAIVQIPLKTNPSVGDEVHCLYSRHLTGNLEDNHQKIPWKSVEVGRSCVKNGRAIIETYDFGLFVLIIRPRPLSANKTIRARVGGRLLVHDLPSVEINFPKEATPDDTIKASARIYLDTEESVAEILSRRDLNLRSRNPSKNFKGDEPHSCLATPIIELDPHGIKFNGEPVTVTLPVPDHEKIVSVLGTAAKLSIWQSSTASNEPSCWEKLEVDFKINHTKMNGEPVTLVSFPVRHFSFFKGVWSVIADYLYEAKIGMMFYFVSFPMKCHANMDEFVGTVLTVTNENVSKEKTDVPEDGENSEQKDAVVNERRFGLEINVCQADKPWPPKTLYKHEVGRSNEKLVKPGKITVKLKSHYFEPDVLAGEEELEKEEPDFRGRDFGLQFACKFKPNVNIERGPFGKVLVTRHFSPRQKGQPIFEFNLQKQGNEAEIQPPRSPNDTNNVEWSHVALYEFAQNLFIIEGENWKLFAKEVGMTHQEIRNISWNDGGNDPFKKIVDHYKSRGGTPEEFVDAMYKCHRSLKVNGNYSPDSKKSKSSNGSSGRGSLSSNNVNFDPYGSHDSDTSGTQSRDSGLPHGRKRSHPSVSNPNPRASGSGTHSGSTRSSYKQAKRARFVKPQSLLSFVSEDVDADGSESDSDDNTDNANAHIPGPSSCLSFDESQQCRNDKTKLESLFLWDISIHLNISSWRALGRSLGLDESVLIDVDNLYKSTSFRECSYQMLLQWKQKFPSKCTYGTLYCALMKEGMNDVAKQMATITRNSSS